MGMRACVRAWAEYVEHIIKRVWYYTIDFTNQIATTAAISSSLNAVHIYTAVQMNPTPKYEAEVRARYLPNYSQQ